ncbi:MAG: hypothetical protein CMB45_04875 [Euryarchaeota archaeon]|nr:hypothetical protein [Euryarchaeota archaeon]|tara:strand:+ start:4977 stop:5648 length:672 start_codon:yes stop_codon:yes gene_type:complete
MTKRVYSSQEVSPEDVTGDMVAKVKAHQCRGAAVGCYLGHSTKDGGTTYGRPHFSSRDQFTVHAYRLNFDSDSELISVTALGKCSHASLEEGEQREVDEEQTAKDIASTIDIILAQGALINRIVGRIHPKVRRVLTLAREGRFLNAIAKFSQTRKYLRSGWYSDGNRIMKAIIELIQGVADNGIFDQEEADVLIAIAEQVRQGARLPSAGANAVKRFLNEHDI